MFKPNRRDLSALRQISGILVARVGAGAGGRRCRRGWPSALPAGSERELAVGPGCHQQVGTPVPEGIPGQEAGEPEFRTAFAISAADPKECSQPCSATTVRAHPDSPLALPPGAFERQAGACGAVERVELRDVLV